MRISEDRVRRIIREETRRVLREATFDLARGIEYTAVVLDDESHNDLAGFAPEGWRVYAHHMTVVPPTQQGSGPRWEYSGYRMGDEVELRAVAIARNDRVVAVAIETDLPTKVGIPHVTIATNPDRGGKPKDSNEFTEEDFEPLDEPILLVGTLDEVPRGALSEATLTL